jgi:hypothetical protein
MACPTDTVPNGLLRLLHLLYQKDILGEDIILKWYNSGDESSTAAALRKQVMSTGRTVKVFNQIHNTFTLQHVHYLLCNMSSGEETHSSQCFIDHLTDSTLFHFLFYHILSLMQF